MTEVEMAAGEPQIHEDAHGRRYERIELNGHWVEYRFIDGEGRQTHVIAFPRVAIISDETIKEVKRLDDAEAAALDSSVMQPSPTSQKT